MNVCEELVFKRVFERWQQPLQHFLQARGLALESAADQVQECFLRLWKNCTDVSENKSKSYLFTTASRLQIDDYRKAKVRLSYIDQSNKSSADRKDGQYLLEESEFKTQLESTLNTMTEKSRVVFMMNRYDKMTYKNIAETLDISVKAVEKRMSKALQHMLSNKINLKK